MHVPSAPHDAVHSDGVLRSALPECGLCGRQLCRAIDTRAAPVDIRRMWSCCRIIHRVLFALACACWAAYALTLVGAFAGASVAKWHRIAAVGDKLFCAPFHAPTVLVIDTNCSAMEAELVASLCTLAKVGASGVWAGKRNEDGTTRKRRQGLA